jgi:hypothetical protein
MSTKIIADTNPGLPSDQFEPIFRSGLGGVYQNAHRDLVDLQRGLDDLVAPLLSMAERANIAQIGILMEMFPEGSKVVADLTDIQQRKLAALVGADANG